MTGRAWRRGLWWVVCGVAVLAVLVALMAWAPVIVILLLAAMSQTD